ncbi:MAG: hypothetical protein BMS9Abin36_2213 [Gammaproteobacteria bacterium]|nr:MAG: hypothetical protein BMS9Abin36_2213 [Gammaproteobacteria bacterium]
MVDLRLAKNREPQNVPLRQQDIPHIHRTIDVYISVRNNARGVAWIKRISPIADLFLICIAVSIGICLINVQITTWKGIVAGAVSVITLFIGV